MTPSHENINSPKYTDDNFDDSFGLYDMARLEALAKYFKGGIYLDAGCGDSIMPVLLAERYPESKILAVDYAPGLIDFLSERFPKVRYINMPLVPLPFADSSIDYIVAGEVIEHLEDPKAFISEMMRLLKPGGYLAVSTPLEEKHGEIGGKAHLWSFTEQSVRTLLATGESEIIKLGDYNIIMAWRKK